MTAPIRIDDLRAPRLDAAQRSALEYVATLDIRFDADDMLAGACERAGCDDFGDPGFRPRLAATIEAVEADTGLGPLGRLAIRQRTMRLLTSRLLLEDLVGRRPDILDIELTAPVIVIGLPRSGTTHLVNLVASDARLRSLPFWESLEPCPRPGDGPGRDGVDPRFARCRRDYDAQMEMVPMLRAMHHQYPTAIEEEIELQDLDFASYTLEWLARVPGWRDFYLALDQRPHYAYLKKVLQVLTFLRGPNRWVLKSPQHLEQIPALLATFPDATFAITHRDPVSVIQSAVTMLAYGDRMRRTSPEPEALAGYWVDRVDRLLQACVRDRELLPDDRTIDVLFHEFMRDDVAMVERIYARNGLPMTTRARRTRRVHAGEPARQARPARVRPARRLRARPRRRAQPLRLLLRALPRTGGDRMSDTLRTAMVGCGAISHWHLDAIERAGIPMTITAAVDPDPAQAGSLAARTGADAFASLAAALDDRRFDAALVAVPHHLHEAIATEALQAGLHVLLEKPLAPTLDACTRILGTARAAGSVFMVAENAQYWPEVLTVRDLIRDGAIGDVVTARAATFFPALGDFYGGERPWRFDRAAAGGGVVVDTGSHWLRPLRVWLGEADEVVAALGYPHPEMEGESLCRALIRFESGVVAAFDAMLTTGAIANQPLFTVTGSRGEITVEGSGWVKLWDGSDWKGTKVGERGGYLQSYEGELADFAAAVLRGTTPVAAAEYAVGELRLALAMYRSAETKQWEKVGAP